MARCDKWLTFTACLLHQFFVSGTLKANGVFVASIVQHFRTNHTIVAWAFGLQSGLIYMMSPVTRLLLRRFSHRKLSIFGGLFAGLGYIYCGLFASDVWQMFISVAISGAGLGIADLPHYLALKQHFKQDFPKISTLASLFHFVGVATLPPIAQYLKDMYGLQGALVIMGAIIWNNVAGGFAIIRTPDDETNDGIPKWNSNSEEGGCSEMKIGLSEDKLTWSDKYLPCLSSLFRHKNFPYLMTIEGIAFYIYTSWALFLVTLGVTQGLSDDQAALLPTVGGVAGAMGRLFATALFHFDKMNPYMSSAIPFLVNGVTMLTSPFVTNFFLLATLSAFSGFSQGLNQSSILGILPSIVCHGHFAQAAVIGFSVDGIMMQLGGLVSGVIYDVMGSVIYVFWFNAIVCFIVVPLGFLWGCRATPLEECSCDEY